MKKRKLQIQILLLITVILSVAACDALIAPTNGRENPNDPSNPVPIITDLSISNITENSVTLSWTPQADTSGSYPSLLILSNTTAEPANTSDGTSVVDISLDETVLEQTITDLTNSTTYYFSAWTYSEIDGETVYTGPVSVSGQTYKERFTGSVQLDSDGYVDDMMMRYFADPELFVGENFGMAEEYRTLVRFNNIPSNSVFLSANLIFYCANSTLTSDQNIVVKNIIQPWDPAVIMWTTTDSVDFSESIANGTQTISPGFSGTILFDVTDALNTLKDGGAHYGFILYGPEATAMDNYFQLVSIEDGGLPGPILNVDYYVLPD